MTDLVAIAALRATLWQGGYRPVPLLSPTDPDKARAGKAPLQKDWTARARQNPPEGATAPAQAHLTNTGILADTLRLIDVDVDDFGRADAIEQLAIRHFGGAPTRRRDNSNRLAMLYRAAEGEPSKRTLKGTTGDPEHPDQIEVLGKGQQFVAYGTHATGGAIYWTGPEPLDMAADELPAVTEAQVTAFLAEAAAIIGAPEPARKRQAEGARRQVNGNGNSRQHGNGTTDPAALFRLASALEALPGQLADEYDSWILIGCALHHATDGTLAGRDMWDGWSQQSPKYTTDEIDRRWESFANGEGEEQASVGTIYHLARKHGWVSPDPEPPEEWEERHPPRDNAEPGRAPGNGRETHLSQVAGHELPIIEWHRTTTVEWADRAVPDLGWIVPHWIPRQQVTGLYGIGGVNKTDFLIQLLMARSRGLIFIGHPLEASPTYGLFCEDTEPEIIRRAARIAGHYGLGLADFPDFHFASLVGFDAPEFVTFDGAEMRVGFALLRFDHDIQLLGAGLAALDTIPDFFGGNEIVRRDVSRFMRKLDAISTVRDCAILYTAHPSVRGRASGALDSGSTGWEGKVRSRLSLHDPGEPAEEEEPSRKAPPKPTDRRILTRHKSNYAPRGETLELVCKGGFFSTAALDPDRAAKRGPMRNMACEVKFLELLRKVNEQGGYVHDAGNAPTRYAPAVFAKRPDGRGYSAAEYARAMQRLFVAKRLRLETSGRKTRLVEAPAEVSA